MPPALERLIISVAERMAVDVYLPDAPAAAQAPVADLGRRLVEQGGALVVVDRSIEPEVALGWLRAALFTPPAGPGIPADDTVQLVSAPDPAREVRAAARACLEWAAEGVEFWEMAVAYRHGEAYRPLVEAVFIEAGIPLYLHEGSPLAERPLGR